MSNALRVGGGCYSWGSFALLIGIGLGLWVGLCTRGSLNGWVECLLFGLMVLGVRLIPVGSLLLLLPLLNRVLVGESKRTDPSVTDQLETSCYVLCSCRLVYYGRVLPVGFVPFNHGLSVIVDAVLVA